MSIFLVDYLCASCEQTFEVFQDSGEVHREMLCECGGTASRCLSAVKSKTVWGAAASTGKSDPPPPGAMDTRPLADREISFGNFRTKRKPPRYRERG